MYNKTDGAGWCFTAYCNLTCGVEKAGSPCHSTTQPTSATTTVSSGATTQISSTANPLDCPYLTPPRKVLQFSYINMYSRRTDHLSLIGFVSRVHIWRKPETRSLILLDKE